VESDDKIIDLQVKYISTYPLYSKKRNQDSRTGTLSNVVNFFLNDQY